MKRLLAFIFAVAFSISFHDLSFAQNNLAPGAPGKDAQWESAGKTGVGTSTTLESKVWFTLLDGVMTEVYYPTVDVANVRLLQFIVVDKAGKVETERDDAIHTTEAVEGLTFRQTNKAKSGAWEIVKTYITDVERSTVLIDVEFREKAKGAHFLSVYYDPSLNNSGMHDSAWSQDGVLLASDADKASALISSTGFERVANGYFGTVSDPLKIVGDAIYPVAPLGITSISRAAIEKERRDANETYVLRNRAANGNVVQLGTIRNKEHFSVALGFGREADEALSNARASLAKSFTKAQTEYEQGWREYVKTLRKVDAKYQRQFEMAAMVMRAHEDKTYRGAQIASLSVPWGGGANANEPNVGGYHLVWSRDLYQVATAYLSLGDKAAADRALNYLFKVQQKADGSFPQNSWLDGRPFWGSLQLDEVALPVVLAHQLGRTDNETYAKHIKPAADFIIKSGAYSPQERWEEESGYSPSTIAAEIAGLVAAGAIARQNNDEASASIYEACADDFARNVEAWTATTNGFYGDKNYYLRITENDNPNDGELRELNNGAGSFDERKIVDAGFLELVRLGIKPPNDALIAKSVRVIDELIKVETPNGTSFYRYNFDGYGEMDDGRPWNFDGKYTGKGRLWALLAGERGQYELANGRREDAIKRLDAMLGFANEGLMLPEQIWDKPAPLPNGFKFGEGTGSATPLAWSMAQFIRLAVNIQEGRNMDTPEIVASRYVKNQMPMEANIAFDEGLSEEALSRVKVGELINFNVRVDKGSKLFMMVGSEARELTLDANNHAQVEMKKPDADFVAFAVRAASGATAFAKMKLKTSEIKQALNLETIEQLKNAKSSPLVIGDDVYFLSREGLHRGQPAMEARDATKRIEVVGDMTNWRARGLTMQPLADTNLLYYKTTFPADARVEYKFVANGEWINDSLNANKIDNGVGSENSVLEMPEYEPDKSRDKYVAYKEMLLLVSSKTSSSYRGDLKVKVFLPKEYTEQPNKRFRVLYLQDGSEYLARSDAAIIASMLTNSEQIKPFIIVFVDPINRMKEYWANDAFADFMAKELVPFIDAKYRTQANRDGRALLGASLGGVQSMWTYLKYPELFSRVGGQSSAFWIDDERTVKALMNFDLDNPKLAARFYLDAGTIGDAHESNRRVATMLRARGANVTYKETPAGHNWTAWRDRLADAFIALMK